MIDLLLFLIYEMYMYHSKVHNKNGNNEHEYIFIFY